MNPTGNEVSVALGGRLPTGDGNGLAGMGYKLTKDHAARRQIRAAIILFDVSEVADKTDDGSQKAKLRVRRIEVIQDPEDFGVMQRILMREFERRTGQTTLPFELEGDINSILSAVEFEETRTDPWVGKRTWPDGSISEPSAESVDDGEGDSAP